MRSIYLSLLPTYYLIIFINYIFIQFSNKAILQNPKFKSAKQKGTPSTDETTNTTCEFCPFVPQVFVPIAPRVYRVVLPAGNGPRGRAVLKSIRYHEYLAAPGIYCH